jgi:nitrogenase-stabilizing/protective protein
MDEELLTLDEALEELASAEDFLNYFHVPFDQSVVHVNRLHILQRFHDYLARMTEPMPSADEQRHAVYHRWLSRAYQDFVESDSLTEKVFAVFQTTKMENGGLSSFVPIEKVFR